MPRSMSIFVLAGYKIIKIFLVYFWKMYYNIIMYMRIDINKNIS
jgi:hypothetical protein